MSVRLSIVVPVVDDDLRLAAVLRDVAPRSSDDVEIIVVDGLRQETTRTLVQEAGAQWVGSQAGRGYQIAHGIRASRADWIWVLHADSKAAGSALERLLANLPEAPAWGRFDVDVSGLRLVSGLMNLRSALTLICTGDQAMFFHRTLLEACGGFPEQALMEDIEISTRLKRQARDRFMVVPGRIGTSARRWRSAGVIRTIFKMWGFRLRYFFGADPEVLYRDYYGR